MSTFARPTAALALAAGLALAASDAHAQNYRFPTSADDYTSYYPTAYFDHAGVDWNCGSIRYDGHRGSDFGGGSWAGMDAGRDVVAAAAGVVTATHDGEFDQCSTGDCPGGGGYGNNVWITHPDGKSTLYGHLKNGSVAVAPGDFVACGDYLGLMGSSGHSTGPHLHFGVWSIDSVFQDPFWGSCSSAPSYWVEQGAYDELPGLVCDAPPPACAPVELLSCGAHVAAESDGPGSTQAHGYYGCGLEFVYSGPELAWRFATDLDEPVTVTVTGLSADLDLSVLDSDACDASDCIATSTNSAGSDETTTFQASAGHTYVVVLDGYQGAASSLELTIDCNGQLPEPTGGGGSGGSGMAGAGGSGASGATGAGGAGAGANGAGVTDAETAGSCGCHLPGGSRGGGALGAASLALALLLGRARCRARRARENLAGRA